MMWVGLRASGHLTHLPSLTERPVSSFQQSQRSELSSWSKSLILELLPEARPSSSGRQNLPHLSDIKSI